jgi:hypothetical protein
MGGFLTGLGDIAGGAAAPLQQDLNQYFQQQQANQDATNAGLGVYAMLGIPPPSTPQQGQGGLGGILSSLLGGGQQGQQQAQAPSSQAPPPPAMSPLMQANIQQPPPAQMPQLGQGGQARSPMSAPQAAPAQIQGPGQGQSPLNVATAAPNAPVPSASIQGNPVAPVALQGAPPAPVPPVPRGQPATAQPGVTAPGQQPQAAPPPQPQAQQQQNQAIQPQSQQPGQQQAMDKYKDMFDYPTLVRNLVNTPGMNPTKLGKIISSDGFKNMLTQEGLAQYRNANLGIRGFSAETGRLNSENRAGEADRNAADRERNAKYANEARVYGQSSKQAGAQISLIRQQTSQKINAIASDFNLKQDEKQKQIQALQDQETKAIDDINKKVGDPPQMEKESSSSGEGGGAEAGVMYDAQGNPHKYKGQGDRADPANWD